MSVEENGAVTNSLFVKKQPKTGDRNKCEKRQTWSSELDFIMTTIGSTVGLANIWRFPYLCYRNGGGAFLIPYFFSFFVMSVPIYMLEVSLGQYTSSGCLGGWNIVPAFQGIGWCTMVIMFYMNIYYIIVIAWALYYLFRSFASHVPWATCTNTWNTDRCFVTGMNLTSTIMACANTTDRSNTTTSNCTTISNTTDEPRVDAVVEFWENSVLHQSSGIHEMGDLVPGLAIALCVAWVIMYLCLFQGVKFTGKIVYFTVLFPYVLLVVLFFRGVTLDGAADGIKFYLKPDFTRLGEAGVWIDAVTQVLFSCGSGQGFLLTLGSYNKYHDNAFRNCLIVAIVNCCTSMFGGFCVFSVLGFMAKELGQPISKVVSSGPGLVFLAYPKAITQLPLSSLWACLFFILILLMGMDSQFAAMEGFTTPIADLFPRKLYKPRNRMLLLTLYCVLCCLLGLTMVTEGGVYLFRLVDYYACSGLVALVTVFFECVAIGWAFGVDRYYDALELMLGRRLGRWMKICWNYLTPAVTLSVFLFQLVTFKPLQYDANYQYPVWATALGIFFILNSTLCIPAVMSYRAFMAKGSIKQRWRELLTPTLKSHQVHPKWHGQGYRWRLANYEEYDVNYDVDTSRQHLAKYEDCDAKNNIDTNL